MPGRIPSYRPPHRQVRLSDGRPSAAARGYDSRWRRLRESVIRARPVCEECNERASTDVDHVVSKASGGGDEESNLRALCHSCHSSKTVAVDGGLGRPRP